jgi:hypothetical protein
MCQTFDAYLLAVAPARTINDTERIYCAEFAKCVVNFFLIYVRRMQFEISSRTHKSYAKEILLLIIRGQMCIAQELCIYRPLINLVILPI